MNRVSCICESMCPPDCLGGCDLCLVGFGRAHEGPPVLDGMGMSKNHTFNWMDAHVIHQALMEEFTYKIIIGVISMIPSNMTSKLTN